MKKIKLLLGNFSTYKLFYLTFLLIFLAIFEFLSLGAIYPAIKTLTNTEFSEEISNLVQIDIEYFLFVKFFSILLIFLFSFKAIFSIFTLNCLYRYVFQYSRQISLKIFMNLLDYNYFIKGNYISDTLKKLTTDIHHLSYGVLIPIFMFVSEFFISLSLLFLLIIIFSLKSFLIFFIPFIIFLFFIRVLFKPIINKIGEIRSNKERERSKIIHDTFVNLREILILKKNKYFEANFDQTNKNLAAVNNKQAIIEAIPKYLLEFLIIFSLSLYLLYLSEYRKTFEINSIPSLGIAVIIFLRLTLSTSRQITYLSQIKYFEKIINFFVNINKKNTRKIKIKKKKEFLELSLKNISFYYKSSKKIFNKLNLKIKKNDFIVITGDNGTGKSTLINLILGFIKPKSGNVLLNKKNLQKDISRLHDCTCFIPQNFFLLNSSVINNITLSENYNKHTKKKINYIFKNSFFKFFKNNLYKIIGENGSKISGGQRQVLAFLRAEFFNRDLLILDEPSTALDRKSINNLLQYLESLKGKKTIILITHQKEFLKLSNKILNLNKLKIK